MRFMRDLFTLQLGSFFYMGLTFVSSILFARLLGIEQYGLYAIVLAFVGTVATFVNLGQGPALLIFFAEEHGKKNMAGMSAVLRNYLHISLFNTVLLVTCAVFAPSIAKLLYSNELIGTYARLLFLFQAIDSFNSMTIILLQSMRRIRQKVLFEQSQNFSAIILSIASLFLGFGIKGILISQLAVSAFFLIVTLVVIRLLQMEKAIPGLRDISSVRFVQTEAYFLQGLLIALDKNIGNFFPQGLLFFLSFVAPASTVGIARIATQMATVPRTILLPQAGDLSATAFGNMKSQGVLTLRRNMAKLIKHALALQSMLTLGAVFGLPIIIYIAYSRDYLNAIPLTIILLPLSLPVSVCIANSSILRLYRRIHYSTIQAVATWGLMYLIIVGGSRVVSPETAFVLAYAVGLTMPMLLTGYIFTRLLVAKNSATEVVN